MITRDNVTARVDAVAYFRVVDPNASVVERRGRGQGDAADRVDTLRSVLGKADLDALLSERERLNEDLQQIIDEQTEPWGIKATTLEIKDVSIPAAMQRAMSRQAEAERERRAKVIHAEGEFQAAAKLSQAAAVISECRPRSSCATCRRCRRSAATSRTPRSSSRSRWTLIEPLLAVAGRAHSGAPSRPTAPRSCRAPPVSELSRPEEELERMWRLPLHS